MRVVCISDTHGQYLDVPDGDVLIHAGDGTALGTLGDVLALNTWFGKLPHKHKFLVPGNHDGLFLHNSNLARAILTNATLLLDSGTTFSVDDKQYSIYGTPWVNYFRGWPFELDNEAQLRARYRRIPEVDILVTHNPPFGLFDRELGSKVLRDIVAEMKPRLHVFGHLHDGGQVREGDTISVNAAVVDDENRLVGQAVVVEL